MCVLIILLLPCLCLLCSCYGPKELSKKFGRAFDVDVDVPDFSRYEATHSMGCLVDRVHAAELSIAQVSGLCICRCTCLSFCLFVCLFVCLPFGTY